MIMKIFFLCCVVCVGCVGCAKEPISRNDTTNPEIKVSLLFDFDGMKIYRFTDCGRSIYFTDARGATAWSINRGKGGTEYLEVETVRQ